MNRDEALDRRTSSLEWQGDILAGRRIVNAHKKKVGNKIIGFDEKSDSHGTWLGVNRSGKLGVILSLLDPANRRTDAPSRGKITMDYLKGGDPAEEFFKNLKVKSQNFNGFNFLGIESDKNDRYRLVTFTSKFVDELKPLVWNASGIYGFGNSPPHTPFRKVVHGTKLFENLLRTFQFSTNSEDELIEEILKIATNRDSLFPDEQVRKQISGESNRFVTDEEYAQYKYQGSIFMRHPTRNYGTRTHSVLLVSNNNEVTFLEKTLVLENRIADVVVSTESGQFWTTKKEIFKIK